MNSNMRTISINVMPARDKSTSEIFIAEIQQSVEKIIEQSKFNQYLQSGQIALSWYDDFPASDLVSVILGFSVLEGVDLAGELTIALRKKGYNVVGTNVGY